MLPAFETDLRELYQKVIAVDESLRELDARLHKGFEASLGEADDEGNEIRAANDDDPETFEAARYELDKARSALLRVRDYLEGAEGARRLRVR